MKAKRHWQQLILKGAVTCSEWLPALLIEWGALGVEEKGENIIAFFDDFIPIQRILEQLDEARKSFGVPPFDVSVSRLAEENWQENWRRFFKPVVINQKIVVKPSWESFIPVGEQIVITIDPEQAFGTGTHATTHLMLQYLAQFPPKGRRVLDVGTGSGILAIAAAKLGAAEIVGLDIDPVAVRIASKNCRIHGETKRVRLYAGEPNALGKEQKFDLILANIISGILIPMLPSLASRLARGDSELVLSGILEQEEQEMCTAIRDSGLTIVARRKREEWLALVCERGDSNG